jgi:zinc transport system permease protein
MTFVQLEAITLSSSMAVAAGLVGCFAVMRRMTLAADAISHIALPGIGVALLLHVSPLIGALVMLFLGTLLIWSLELKTKISTETVIGVVFTVALAIGSFLTSGEELIDALFGAPGNLTSLEIGFGLGGAAIVISLVLVLKNALIVSLVSPDIASTSGINVASLNLMFLLAFALTVALGIRYLGVLLMGSLMIIPAVTARRLATNLTGMLAISVGVAVASTMVGLYLGALLHRETGPLIVSVAGGIFFLSLLARRVAGRPRPSRRDRGDRHQPPAAAGSL